MNANSGELYNQLEQNLKAIVKVYRHLLSIVRQEKDILISADLDRLNENNHSKEVTLIRAKKLESERLDIVRKLAVSEGLDPEVTRLLDFAKHFGGEQGEKLMQTHSVLDLLLKRVRSFNEQNEVLVNAALDNITGGIQNIKDSIGNKKNYKKGGKLQNTSTEAGQLVSREV